MNINILKFSKRATLFMATVHDSDNDSERSE